MYKSTGDIAAAKKMFDDYTTVDNSDSTRPWLSWREIVIKRRRPRTMFVQANTVKSGKLVRFERGR